MSEKDLAKKDGASLVKNSGRGFHKGDAILEPFLLDYKEYSSSYTISKVNWEKHKTDSRRENWRQPCIAVVLDETTRLAIIDWDMFIQMREVWNENELG